MQIYVHRATIKNADKIVERQHNISDINYYLQQTKFGVELDVRMINNQLFLGHDWPEQLLDINNEQTIRVNADRILFHCKDINSYCYLSKSNFNCFTLDKDHIGISSKGDIIINASLGIIPINEAIIAMPEHFNPYEKLSYTKFNSPINISNCKGVITEEPERYL